MTVPRRVVALAATLVALIAGVLVLGASSDDRGPQLAVVDPAATPSVPATSSTDPATLAPSTAPASTAPSAADPAQAATVASTACRLGDPGAECGTPPTPALPGCPDEPRGAVVDKTAQRFWLCQDGAPITDARPMTSASERYGLPPVTPAGEPLRVFAKNAVAYGIHGERLERFVAFYTTPRGNRIAFHQYVDQEESTLGDLSLRGASSGCLRIRTDDSYMVWDFLQIGDPVVILTA